MKCYYCKLDLIFLNDMQGRFMCNNIYCFAKVNYITPMYIYPNANYYIPFKSDRQQIGGYAFGYKAFEKILIDITYNRLPKNKHIYHHYHLPYHPIKDDTDVGKVLQSVCKLLRK